MKDLKIYIGKNVNGKPQHSTESILKAFNSLVNAEAYTVTETLGMYKGQPEASLTIELLNQSSEGVQRIKSLIPELAQALEQESIFFTAQESTVNELIFASKQQAQTK